MGFMLQITAAEQCLGRFCRRTAGGEVTILKGIFPLEYALDHTMGGMQADLVCEFSGGTCFHTTFSVFVLSRPTGTDKLPETVGAYFSTITQPPAESLTTSLPLPRSMRLILFSSGGSARSSSLRPMNLSRS